MKKSIPFIVSICAFFVVFLATAIFAVVNYWPENSPSLPEEPQNSNISSTPQESSSQSLPENPIDFGTLKAKNQDIYAWIRIPDTNVDYAIVQSGAEPEDFYLDHNLDKKYQFSGSIYTQKINLRDFSDANTVIYGHNMKNGTMFADVIKYRNAEFFKTHDTIYIYTPDRILTYKVFSAYRYDNRHLLYSFNFDDKAVFADYLKNTATNPKSTMVNVNKDVQVTADDRIITLSTCITGDAYRYLVQGVLIDEQPTR